MKSAEENEVRRILEKGLCTQQQVDEAEAIHQQMQAMGLRPRSVGEVLCERGYLEGADFEEIQREVTTVEGREQIAGYEIVELLGRGAMGAVYKARQISLDRFVALKILDPELAADAEYAERFMNEARAVARMSHTNLVSGIDVGEEDGIRYLVMEYADGVTLARLLRRGGALDEERALVVALQIARALSHAHKGQVCHGDVRPENVIVTSDAVTKLCDLGIARRPLVAGDAEGGELRRTPDYISPEQARGLTDADETVDVYGLGASLFHMLTGRVPFPAESREAVLAKHLTEPAPPVRTIVPDLGPETEAVVTRCLSKGPADRYPDGAALVQALEGAIAAVQAARGATPAVATAPTARPPAATPPAAQGPTGVAPRTRRQRRRGR